MKKIISTWLVMWAVWLLLAGFKVEEIVLGGVVTLVISFLVSKFVAFEMSMMFPLQTIKFIFIYIPLFIYKLVIANIQLALIVLNPKLPIKPGFVKVTTALESDLGKLTLANSITLTPGTLSMDIKKDEILVHWVKVEDGQEGKISMDFEKVLGGIYK